ncbi:hypothetical protein ABVK25_009560 [Lepraria finkii]|uniref:Uncharacterized protein n=1 Tax=Lepraria finkii TaxID=1340010 RepID=A0ABR4AXC0_9LECA
MGLCNIRKLGTASVDVLPPAHSHGLQSVLELLLFLLELSPGPQLSKHSLVPLDKLLSLCFRPLRLAHMIFAFNIQLTPATLQFSPLRFQGALSVFESLSIPHRLFLSLVNRRLLVFFGLLIVFIVPEPRSKKLDDMSQTC